MQRRAALATAGAISATLMAAATATAFSSGVLSDDGRDDGVGTLDPVVATDLAPSTTVVPPTSDAATVEVTSPATGTGAPTVEITTADPVASTAASAPTGGGSDDDRDQGEHDDAYEDDDVGHEDSEHDDDHHDDHDRDEYEGYDDDD